MSTSVDLYVDLIAAAYDSKTEDDTQKRTAAYYAANTPFAFAAALRLVPAIDIARVPAVQVFELLQTAIDTGVLRPAAWYQAAVLAARSEFERYKAHVSSELGDIGERMAETGEWSAWAADVKLTDFKSQRCSTWRRIKSPRTYIDLRILDEKLQDRVLLAKTQTPAAAAAATTTRPRTTTRVAVLSSARVYMEMAKCAVRDSLRASLAEAVQLRIHRMSTRAQPTAATAGPADVIPDFAPTLTALHEVRSGVSAHDFRQETETLLRQYTDVQTLTQSLSANIEEAERQHRRTAKNGAAAAMFSQSDWFVTKLRQMAEEAREPIQVDDDDNGALRETVDDDMKAALQAFGTYLAHNFLATQTAIVQDELTDAADIAALVLPETAVQQIAGEHLQLLSTRETAFKVGRAVAAALARTSGAQETVAAQYAEYEKQHMRRVVSFRVEQSFRASQSDASLKMAQRLEQAAAESKQWLKPNDNAMDNIRRLLVTRISLPMNAKQQPPQPQRPERLSHAARFLFFCRELADTVSQIRRVEIERLHDELRRVWDRRSVMLTELADAVGKADSAGNVNDAPWELRLPMLSARADIERLLPTPISVRLRTRLGEFVDQMTKKVQRPLPIRPRGARDQCQRVVSDLDELSRACSTPAMALSTAWLHLPCVLWSETYAELVDSVNADQAKRRATEQEPPAAKRLK